MPEPSESKRTHLPVHLRQNDNSILGTVCMNYSMLKKFCLAAFLFFQINCVFSQNVSPITRSSQDEAIALNVECFG